MSTTPPPSKYPGANTLLSDLSPESKEILNTISTCKKIVRHTKTVSTTANTKKLFIFL